MKHALLALLLLSLGLAACERQIQPERNHTDPPREVPQPGPQRPVEAPAQVSSLAGEWRVAGIDGDSLDEPVALALTGDDDQLWWEPRCAGMARNYRIESHWISFGSSLPPIPAGSPTPSVCGIGVSPRIRDVFRALDDAVSVARTPNNGIVISGPRHSLTLFSQ